jgi:hypothetical protein
MTRYHGATKTCRYGCDGSVSASASAGRLAHEGADGVDRACNFQARKRRPRGVLSTLIPRVPGRRLTAMNAHAAAQPEDLLSATTYRHSSPLVGVKRLVGCRDPDSGGSRLVRGREATAGMLSRRDG